MSKRGTLKFIGRFLVHILTRFELIGLENLPDGGAYIMAGNHVASMESLLMVCFAPRMIEIVGSGDIPLDPKFAPFANLYGYIPINRGEIDQRGLNGALAVLESGEVLGVFPEGGIWETTLREPKIGISWLAMKADAAVVPIGFVGMKDALKNALSFRLPRIKMVIGKPLTPAELFSENLPLKIRLLEGAQRIMREISSLLPGEEKNMTVTTELQHLTFERKDLNSGTNSIFTIEHQVNFSKLIQHPVIMDVFSRNLKLPVKSLMVRDQFLEGKDVLTACSCIRQILQEKPGFLPYRFGMEEGLLMTASVVEFIEKIQGMELDNSLIRICSSNK